MRFLRSRRVHAMVVHESPSTVCWFWFSLILGARAAGGVIFRYSLSSKKKENRATSLRPVQRYPITCLNQNQHTVVLRPQL
jgi:hypothetical protein